jgi:hypothetical protein
MLLFRGTDWYKGLSPEQIREVVKQMYAWLDRLTRMGLFNVDYRRIDSTPEWTSPVKK